MQPRRVLPIPFMILILAGMIAFGSLLASRSSVASPVPDDSLQIQTVEQERMAATYFRVLSWLTAVSQHDDVSQHDSAPAQSTTTNVSVTQAAKTPQSTWQPVRVSLCMFRSARDFATEKFRAHIMN